MVNVIITKQEFCITTKQDIPLGGVSDLKDKAEKFGALRKLSGKGILTAGTWRHRFCLLVKARLYYFEAEGSPGTDKGAGFVNLEYFDCCTEATRRFAGKKSSANVFVIGASDKGFFESHSGRHYFAADSPSEMKEWVNAINSAMHKIRPTKDKRPQQIPPQQAKEKSPRVTSKASKDRDKEKEKDKDKDKEKDKDRSGENGGARGKHNNSKSSSAESNHTASSNSRDSLSLTNSSLNGSNNTTANNNPGTLPRSSNRLDCALAKSRVRGPAGRRLPRKPNLHNQSQLSRIDTPNSTSSPASSLRKSSSKNLSSTSNNSSSSHHHHHHHHQVKTVAAVVEKTAVSSSDSDEIDEDEEEDDGLGSNKDESLASSKGGLNSGGIRDSRGRATSCSALEKAPDDNNTCLNSSSAAGATPTICVDKSNNSKGANRWADSNEDSNHCVNNNNNHNHNNSHHNDSDSGEDELLDVTLTMFDNFDQAWFLTTPENRSSSPDDRESTSDYFSMHGNANGGSRNLSITPNAGENPRHGDKRCSKHKCTIM